MQNKTLADDYLERAGHRVACLELLMERGSYADVVREAQEVVELALKAVLRKANVEMPRLHDVSSILREHQERLPTELRPHVERMAAISHTMRRDRELAFYGTEDLTPSEFYEEGDAAKALEDAKWIYTTCRMAS